MGISTAAAVFIRTIIGLVLVAAGIAKALEGRSRLLQVIDGYRLLPRRAASATAAVLPGVELATGLLLCLGTGGPAPATGAALLFAGFACGVAINLVRGRSDIACGCFGSRSSRGLSWSIVGRNGVLAATALALALGSGDVSSSAPEALPVALSAVAVALMAAVVVAIGNVRRLDFGLPEPADPVASAPPATASYLPLARSEDAKR